MTATPLLSLRGVSHRYRQSGRDVQALEGVSLDVRDGEFLVLVGASGCGKSTLLRLIAGLMPPTTGEIDRQPRIDERGGIGMVFQRPVLMPWRSVLRNVLVPTEIVSKDDAKQAALDLLARTGLSEFEKAYPHQLSGGMQQRVAICRALLTDPPLLLMDEPFGALDAITRERLNLLLQQIWADTRKTVVLVTHNIEEAVLLADRIVVMSPRPGRIVEVIDNDLPRPRGVHSYQDPGFAELGVHLRSLIVGADTEVSHA
ncbi:ABC transporter ATP-binding protein [Nocardioides ginsengisoli]|uniref:ABC transporter ATP-binding protein n=1 Tax=Nocardioides ginsengisoli TaxID=363868 RepID=A0ABW3W7P6_9ACTN